VRKIIKKEKLSYWELTTRFFKIIEVSAVILGVIFTINQIAQIKNSQSADLILRIDDKLNKQPYQEIASVIEDNKPVLKKQSGRYTGNELEDYLGEVELICNMYEDNLITDDMLNNAFSYEIVSAYKDKEVQEYLKPIRASDSSFYVGFETVGKKLANEKF
jgi:hypothetical protein